MVKIDNGLIGFLGFLKAHRYEPDQPINMGNNYRGRIWSEATKDCPDFLGFLRAHRD